MRFLLLIFPLLLSFSVIAFDDSAIAPKLNLDYGLEGQPWTFIGTNSVYVNEDFSRQMMVVRNVPGKLRSVQFIEADGYLIVNIPESQETITSLALVGITRDAIRPYLENVTWWKNFFSVIPRAHANPCFPNGMANLPGVQELGAFFTTGAGAGFARCLMNFAQGVWSQTGGAVAGFVDGVGNLFSDPRAFWDRRVAQMRNMWRFISHFRSEMGKVLDHLSGLSSEAMTQMMCGFLGGIGAGVAVALVTAGAGLGPLMAQVTSYVSKVAGLARVFSLFSQLGKTETIPTKFYEGIANGRIGENVIDRLDSFARNRMDSVVQGAIQCAI